MQRLGRTQALSLGVGLILVIAASAVGLLLLLFQQDGGRPEGSTWNSYEVNGEKVIVHKTIRPCDEVESASAREAGDHVAIALHVNYGGVCADSAVDGSAAVSLQAPLNGRPVYDASCLGDGPLRDQCLRQAAPGSG